MKRRNVLFACAWLAAGLAGAATITGPVVDIEGNAITHTLKITPLAYQTSTGLAAVVDFPRSVGVTNGGFSVALVGGQYLFDFGPLASQKTVTLPIGDQNTYTLAQVAAAGTNVFNYISWPALPWSNSGSSLLAAVMAGQFEILASSANSSGLITNATVMWPDGTCGTLTVTNIDPVWNAVNGYYVTYTNTGQTVYQSTITRDQNGAVTNAPALQITPALVMGSPSGQSYDPLGSAGAATNGLGSAAWQPAAAFDPAGAGTSAALSATNGLPPTAFAPSGTFTTNTYAGATNALGFAPATNSYAGATNALGFAPATNSYAGATNALGFAPATNSYAGATNALGFAPATNSYAGATNALGFAPATNSYAGATNALGFAPATNSYAGATNALGFAPGTNGAYAPTTYTVATLPANPAAGQQWWASDVVTAKGTGDLVYYDGSNWRTRSEGIVATVNLTNYLLNCWAACASIQTPLSTIATWRDATSLGNGTYLPLNPLRLITCASSTYPSASSSTAYGDTTYYAIPDGTSGGTSYCTLYGPSWHYPGSGQLMACAGIYWASAAADSGTHKYWAFVGFASTAMSATTLPTTAGNYVHGLLYDPNNSTACGVTGSSQDWWAVITSSTSVKQCVDTGLPYSTTAATPARLVALATSAAFVVITNGVTCFVDTTGADLMLHNEAWQVVVASVTGESSSSTLNEAVPFLFARRTAPTLP